MRKPLHKHIAHHIRKYHQHLTKYLYERDTIFATAWVFIFILMVKFIPLPNIHFFDPIEIALKDFDFNDIAYSKLAKTAKTGFDPRIEIINIGNADREGLAYIIDKASSMHPAVIGLDSYFEEPKEPQKDSLLRSVIEKTKNLVVVNRIHWEDEGKKIGFFKDYFDSSYHDQGYANFISEDKDRSTVRMFSPFEKEDGKTYPSFAAALVKIYDGTAFKILQKRNHEVEIINYTRQVNERVKQYQVIDAEDLLAGNVSDSYLRGKIVLLGYVNDNPNDIQDKKFTPLNEKFAGKSVPDMNGVVIHANIISMVLDNNYIKKLPSWVNILAAILIGWLHMSFFIRYYLENHIWFHLVAKFAQLLSAIFFVYLGIYLFNHGIRLDMSLTIIVIVLAVDIIYFYEAFAVWMHRKFGYKTVFHKQHH